MNAAGDAGLADDGDSFCSNEKAVERGKITFEASRFPLLLVLLVVVRCPKSSSTREGAAAEDLGGDRERMRRIRMKTKDEMRKNEEAQGAVAGWAGGKLVE